MSFNPWIGGLRVGDALGNYGTVKFLLDESFDEGSHIDKLLRAPKVAQDLGREEGSDGVEG